MKKLFNLKSAVAVALSAVLFTSCMDSDNTPPVQTPAAFVAVYNAYSPIASTQVTTSNGRTAAIPYGEARGYFDFTSLTDASLTLSNQSTNQIIVNKAAMKLELEKTYSAYVYGKEIPGKFILLKDSMPQNSSDNPQIRLLNLAEGVAAVDLFLGTDKVEQLSNRTQETEASTINSQKFILSTKSAGPQDIVVRATDGTLLAELKAYNFATKGFYSIILQGDKASVGDSTEAKAKALKVAVLRMQ